MDGSPLSRWENFYVIVGSSAGALTGLQFVVITLIGEYRSKGLEPSMQEVRAFGSPTVVHFCVALLISALMSAPWPSLTAAAIALGVCAVGGAAYAVNVIHHARAQRGYKADAEDWFWYIILPIVEYVVLLVSAFILTAHTTVALFLVAATSLLLLFNGIHNSWDTVTYIAVQRHEGKQREDSDKIKAA
jgi:hypothetical protein